MAKVLKIILWLAVLAIIAFLVFTGAKKEVVAPTPEMTGGPAGDRVEEGLNIDTEAGVETSIPDSSVELETETSSPSSADGE
ncbi:MAG: hypothetical protein QG580_283 [Patescibacteria group bacterium]|jgi:hypothetical protein|nr:hypothetical protein [Patescibacteria group bacterium]